MTRVHAFTDDALGDDDALALAARIASGETNSAEVREAAITRVEKIDPTLNAVRTNCFDRPRRHSAGPFAGVPSFIKDNIEAAGLPTYMGSSAVDPLPAKVDAGPSRQFLAQGFALLGKSAMPEFGLTASTESAYREPTRNPWNPAYSAGGSSGGAGALVASGAIPLAHGNDGGGSLRIPAAANGLVGLKLTPKRLLDRPGVRTLPIVLISEGVLTRTVRDTAHYLVAAESYHPELDPVGLVAGPSSRRLRIGFVVQDILDRRVHPEVEATLRSAIAVFEGLGHHVVGEMRFDVSPEFVDDFKTYWAWNAIFQSSALAGLHGRRFDPRGLDPFTKGLARFASRRPHRLVTGLRRLSRTRRAYPRHFRAVDVFITPVVAQPVPLIGEQAPTQDFEVLFDKLVEYAAFTPFANLGGGPAIALPHGMTSSGLPGSVQICARAGAERTLLELAYELEAASPFPRITQ
ncbi:amidase [Smaragdicoccus niigatensis]|uniref:amidase n=1 Tax=Smaragdicoccus niigatensis TaxID=359359 RepID=UPI0003725474|nr:amidase [Smaragdicoccus niigatensis]